MSQNFGFRGGFLSIYNFLIIEKIWFSGAKKQEIGFIRKKSGLF